MLSRTLRRAAQTLQPLGFPARAMAFKLPPLPYDYSALEPFIDTQTMNIHHTKHHQAYVNNVNAALEKFPELNGLGIVELNEKVAKKEIPEEIFTTVRNNGGGHYNHTFFWKVMTKPTDSNGPSADLKAAIDASFGSLDTFKEKFNAAAIGRFGSGWAWLVADQSGKVSVTSSPNQDNPIMMQEGVPILGIDVWEHAFYIKYQNRKPEYVQKWWNVVNWEQVNDNYQEAKAGRVPT